MGAGDNQKQEQEYIIGSIPLIYSFVNDGQLIGMYSETEFHIARNSVELTLLECSQCS